MSELEFRSAQIGQVSFPKRTIELVVMPYETETSVAYEGRMITEVCSRGAYDGVERRSSQIRVNRDHDFTQTVGKTVALHPSRQEGLVAEVRIGRNYDNVLVDADDGLLDASAGFMLLAENGKVKPGAETWEGQNRRRLNHVYLHHIALTSTPAYPDAKVLAVRSADQPAATVAATPNLDWLELEQLRRLAADIDSRYGLTR